MKNDEVTITCYGETTKQNRQDAIRFYLEGMSWCDPYSHEYARYEHIFNCLVAGDTEITDENV